jgi:hypothetical protein
MTIDLQHESGAHDQRVLACLRVCENMRTEQLADISLEEIGAAVRVVLDRWESGDLAEAIRELQAVVGPILPEESPACVPGA